MSRGDAALLPVKKRMFLHVMLSLYFLSCSLTLVPSSTLFPLVRACGSRRQPVPMPKLSLSPCGPHSAMARLGQEPVRHDTSRKPAFSFTRDPSKGQPVLSQTGLKRRTVQTVGHSQQVRHLADLYPTCTS